MPTSKDFAHTRALLNLFRNVMQYSNWWKIDCTQFDCIETSANLKQRAHIHQPTDGLVPHACTQPYHAGSGSHRQLFRPYWGPPSWQSRWVNERGKPASQIPFTAEVGAKQSIKRQLHTTYVRAVGWELHSRSTTTCAGKVDHELPVN